MTETAAPAPPRLAVVLGAAGRAMIIAGIIVLLFVVFQLWGTDLQEARAQDGLRDDLSQRFAAAAVLDDGEAAVTDDSSPDGATAEPDADLPEGSEIQPDGGEILPEGGEILPEGSEILPEGSEILPDGSEILPDGSEDEVLAVYFPDDGDALAQIEIPSIDVDKIVVRGVAVADLRKGPGHYSQTVLPGNAGNAGIAGHRTTYGSPFNRIDELQPGDEVTVTTVQGEFTYRVMDPVVAFSEKLDGVDDVGVGHVIVHPSAAWVLNEFGDDRLTLTACHPKLSSRQRIVVAAELVDPAVELPAWVVEEEALQAAVSETTDQAAATDGSSATNETYASSDQDSATAQTVGTTPAEPDLDEGLSGERDAIPGAALWMLAAITLWYAGGRAGRQFGKTRTLRIAMRLAGLAPAAPCLWFSFEMIDRALPAG